MSYVWKNYKEELIANNSSSFPFDLKDNYTSNTSKLNIKENNNIEGVLFLAESLKREVMSGTLKQQKKKTKQLKKLFLQFAMISMTVGLGMSLEMITAQAATQNLFTTTANTTPQITDINPSEIMRWGLLIAVIVVSIGLALSMVLISIVGIYLMLTRKRSEAISWNSDIIKGVTQILVSIPLIYALFQLSQFIFQNIPFLNGLM